MTEPLEAQKAMHMWLHHKGRDLPRRSRADEGRNILLPVSASALSMKLTG